MVSLVLLSVIAKAQTPFPLKYIDEIGHMDSDLWGDDRKSVDLGVGTAYGEGYETLRVEGRDDAGKMWSLWIPRVTGVGGTEVWKGDLDRNRRQDLVITQYFIQNGRCIDGFDLVILLFDQQGQPHASKARSHRFAGFESPPIIIADLNRNKQAELILTGCYYSEPPRLGEDRWINGIFEARDAEWVVLRNAREEPYLRALQPRLKNDNRDFVKWEKDHVKWTKSEPGKWANSLDAVGSVGIPRLEIEK